MCLDPGAENTSRVRGNRVKDFKKRITSPHSGYKEES